MGDLPGREHAVGIEVGHRRERADDMSMRIFRAARVAVATVWMLQKGHALWTTLVQPFLDDHQH
jgi:hypothetical protein